jgi:thioredoxin 1
MVSKQVSFMVTIVAAITISGCVMQKSRERTAPAPQQNQAGETVTSQPSGNNTKSSSSRYIKYEKDVIDNTNSNRRVLFFYASWCPTCRPADADFTQNENQIPEDVIVIRVNYNDPDTDQEEKKLAQKYGITYQHTFVQIDEQGNEVTKWNGGKLSELVSRIK